MARLNKKSEKKKVFKILVYGNLLLLYAIWHSELSSNLHVLRL